MNKTITISWWLRSVMMLLLLLIVRVLPSIAQCKVNLKLEVKDSRTAAAISSYEITFDDVFSFGDEQGKWSSTVPCHKTYHVHLLYPGYDPIDTDLMIQDKDTTITILMNVSRTTLDDIEVLAHRKEVATTNATSTITKAAILNQSGKGLADMLATVTGMQSIKTGSGIGKPMLQGMHSNRLLILNNGIRQEGQQWGMEHAPEIDPFVADHITVIKGAEAVRFSGEAIGGVILVTPSTVQHDKLMKGDAFVQGQTNGRGGATGLKLSGNIPALGGLQYAVHGSAKFLGNQRTAQYYLDNTGNREFNGSAMLRYHRDHADYNLYYSQYQATLGILSAAHLGSIEDLEYALTHGRPAIDGSFSYDILYPRQQVMHRLLKADAHIHFTDFIHFHSVYGWQQNRRKEYDKRRGGLSSTPSLDLSIHTHTWDNYVEYYDGYNWMLQAGINLLYQDNHAASNTMSVALIPDYIKTEYGGYGVAKYSKGLHQAELGVRIGRQHIEALGYNQQGALYGGQHRYNTIAWNAGYTYKPSNKLTYTTNLGSAYRSPNVNELYSAGLHHGSAQMEYGDSSLRQERSYKWIHAFTFTPNHKWSIEADIFGQLYQDYIYLQALGTYYASLRGVFPEFRYTQANVYFYGGDLTITYAPISWLSIKSSHSITYAQKTIGDDYLPWIPPYRNDNEASIDLPVIIGMKKHNLIIQNQNNAQQRRWSAANDYAPPPLGYSLWHFSYQTTIPLKQHELGVSIGVENVTNKYYKDYLNRYRYYAHELGRNINLRLVYSF